MCSFCIYMKVVSLYLLENSPLTILNQGFLFLLRVKMILKEDLMVPIEAESLGTMCRYCLQNTRNSWDIVRSPEKIVILGTKSTHTYIYRGIPRKYTYREREKGRETREPFLFLKLSPYSLFLDLIFLIHIIICFAFFPRISQNVCNLCSRYIYFGMLSVSFLSKENNFKILCQLNFLKSV